MELQHKILFVSLCLFLCTGVAISRQKGEAEALLRWKSTLLDSTSLSSWSLANSTCSWFGVTCDGAGHITALRLPGAGINGKLDAFYSTALQNLTRLDLSDNNLVGTIPANIFMFLTLTFLDLSSNSFTGAIPYQLNQLPRIASLNLGCNHLTNPEYGKLSPMSNLESLSLANNDLKGTFPWLILNCTGHRMRWLDLSANAFSGHIPGSLPDMVPRLKSLNLSSNGFSSTIPSSFSSLQKLHVLCLDYNHLTGRVPEELGIIPGLEFLSLRNNFLSGSIPTSLGNLTNLVLMDLSLNNLTGGVPEEWE
nr:unnamed protein product [Digitaria exilis]